VGAKGHASRHALLPSRSVSDALDPAFPSMFLILSLMLFSDVFYRLWGSPRVSSSSTPGTVRHHLMDPTPHTVCAVLVVLWIIAFPAARAEFQKGSIYLRWTSLRTIRNRARRDPYLPSHVRGPNANTLASRYFPFAIPTRYFSSLGRAAWE
jgi:hypothetical protein